MVQNGMIIVGTRAIGVTIGAFFLAVGTFKIANGSSHLLRAILGYDLVPTKIGVVLAYGLPWLEALTGLMLILGFLRRYAVLSAYGLLLVYSIAIISSLLRRINNECGCLGKAVPVQWRLVYRNIFLMGLLVLMYRFESEMFPAKRGWFVHSQGIGFPKGDIFLLVLWGSVLGISLVLHMFSATKRSS